MNTRGKEYAQRFILLVMVLMFGTPTAESRHCHGHGHYSGRYCGGNRSYWGGGWGWGPGPYWGYGWPYYGYGWPYYGYRPTVIRVSGDRTIRVVDRTYRVTNRTNRVLRVATTRESKIIQPGDTIRLQYSQKVLSISSENPRERIKVSPRSRAVTIFEAEDGTLRIEG